MHKIERYPHSREKASVGVVIAGCWEEKKEKKEKDMMYPVGFFFFCFGLGGVTGGGLGCEDFSEQKE